MLRVRVVCAGRLKEPYFVSAAREYLKRLSRYCDIRVEEVPEAMVPSRPSPGDVAAALREQAREIEEKIPKGARVVALCIEGEHLSSEELALRLEKLSVAGGCCLCFVVGGSNGLDESIKRRADFLLSMSRMTFPHHLALVMLLEQLYRAFNILAGGKYHK